MSKKLPILIFSLAFLIVGTGVVYAGSLSSAKRLTVYGGVLSVDGNTDVLEIGAAGRDIASTGFIYIRPGTSNDNYSDPTSAGTHFRGDAVTDTKQHLYLTGDLCLFGSGAWNCQDDWTGGGGGSLDAAYDLGRIITVDAGPVDLDAKGATLPLTIQSERNDSIDFIKRGTNVSAHTLLDRGNPVNSPDGVGFRFYDIVGGAGFTGQLWEVTEVYDQYECAGDASKVCTTDAQCGVDAPCIAGVPKAVGGTVNIGQNGWKDTSMNIYSDQAGDRLIVGAYGNYSQIQSVGGNNLYIASTGVGGYITFKDASSGNTAQIVNGEFRIGTIAEPKTLCLNESCINAWGDLTDNDWTISGTDIYSALAGQVGIGQTAPAAKLTVNLNGNSIGSGGDAIYAYANSSNAAISGEQAGAAGWAGWFAGKSYFGGNVGINSNFMGVTPPNSSLVVSNGIQSSGNSDHTAYFIGSNSATSATIYSQSSTPTAYAGYFAGRLLTDDELSVLGGWRLGGEEGSKLTFTAGRTIRSIEAENTMTWLAGLNPGCFITNHDPIEIMWPTLRVIRFDNCTGADSTATIVGNFTDNINLDPGNYKLVIRIVKRSGNLGDWFDPAFEFGLSPLSGRVIRNSELDTTYSDFRTFTYSFVVNDPATNYNPYMVIHQNNSVFYVDTLAIVPDEDAYSLDVPGELDLGWPARVNEPYDALQFMDREVTGTTSSSTWADLGTISPLKSGARYDHTLTLNNVYISGRRTAGTGMLYVRTRIDYSDGTSYTTAEMSGTNFVEREFNLPAYEHYRSKIIGVTLQARQASSITVDATLRLSGFEADAGRSAEGYQFFDREIVGTGSSASWTTVGTLEPTGTNRLLLTNLYISGRRTAGTGGLYVRYEVEYTDAIAPNYTSAELYDTNFIEREIDFNVNPNYAGNIRRIHLQARQVSNISYEVKLRASGWEFARSSF